MDYFHRRNEPLVEYSGHEEASDLLRQRVHFIVAEYVLDGAPTGTYYLPGSKLLHSCRQQFPDSTPKQILSERGYAAVFTLVEILYGLSIKLSEPRGKALRAELQEAFRLSGAVYQLKSGNIELIPSNETAANIETVGKVLSPYPACRDTFLSAVGDLMGRRRKPDDIVKDIFVATEGYLKSVSGENDYSSAVKALSKSQKLNAMQRTILEKLHAYRSDAHGVGHAGNTPSPSETDALWFLETILAQIMHVDRMMKK